jgi:hypothetical protein
LPKKAPKLSDEQKAALRRAAQLELGRRSDRYFCEYNIKIVNKAGEVVPLIFNEVQQELDELIDRQLAEGRMVRIIVLKARQEGISTEIQAKFLCTTCRTPNINALVVAHDDETTTKIFEKQKFMVANLPDDVRPLQKASNARELIFDRPTKYKGDRLGLNSKTYVHTAGGYSIGRGETYRFVHLSEAAYYPGGIKRHLTAIMNAVPKLPGTVVVIETTANGFNDFKDLWDAAVDGENDWTPVFFPWHRHGEYRMACEPGEAESIMGSLNEYERKITELYGLTAEQIKWYRYTLKNDCQGDINLMRQENPSFPEEAFISTGRPVFDLEVIRLRIETLRKEYAEKKPRIGRFAFEWQNPETQDAILPGSIRWIDDPNGIIRIYQMPEAGHPYTVGGDTKGEGHDSYTATVRDNSNGRRVATLKMQLTNSKPYTHQVYCLGMFYNQALVGIEMNFNTAPIEELERLRYPKQYWREIYDSAVGGLQKRHGWKTDGNTRPLLIDREVDLVENNIDLFTDIETLEEMLTFVYDDKNRPDAMPGKHDDLLFSDMIANEIGGQMTTQVREAPKPAEKKLIDDLRRGKPMKIKM